MTKDEAQRRRWTFYEAVNLEGSVIAVRDRLNTAYYGDSVSPADTVVKREVRNVKSARLREALECKC